MHGQKTWRSSVQQKTLSPTWDETVHWHGVLGDFLQHTLHLPDPGIDDARHDLQWSPEHPQLLDATVELLDADGSLLDRIEGFLEAHLS